MVRKAVVSNERTVWTLRIHQCDGVTDAGIAAFCGELDGAYFVAKETEASRVHYQGWIISGLKDVTLRLRIKKAFPMVVGNKGYSLAECKDSDKYQRYICKGTREQPPEVICKSGIEYTEDWIKSQWEAFWADERSTGYELKKAKQTADEVVWEKCDKLDEVTPKNVMKIIIDTYTACGKKFDLYQLKRFCNVVMSKYDKQFRRRLLEAALMDDLYSAYNTHKDYDDSNIQVLLEEGDF